MALRPASRGSEFALVAATCGIAFGLVFSAHSSAFGQTATGLDGLRRATPGLAGAGEGGLGDGGLAGVGAGLVSPPPPPASYTAGAGEAAPDASINYGKPRKTRKRPLPNPPAKTARRPLPPLEAYKTSYELRRRAKLRDSASTDPVQPPPTGIAVVPTIPARTAKPEDPKPFDPVGIRVGSLRFTPYIEGYGGDDSNPYREFNPQKSSPILRGEIGTAVQSEWSQHLVSGEMHLGYSDFPRVTGANRPDGLGKIDSRVDVTRDTSIDTGASFSITTLLPASPELLVGTTNAISTNAPVSWSAGGYAGVTHRFDRLEVSLRGTLERTQTGDATFSDGSVLQLSLDNYTTIGLRPRISYEITPGFKPFVEATVDRRDYDSTFDAYGFQRNSNGFAARAGTSFEISRTLTGEASGGYIQRDYQDPRLVKLHGPTVDASLIWTASPLTKVTLRGSTTASETVIANASGAISHRITGEISHALLRNVTLTGTASYQVTSYQGTNLASDTSYTATGLNERLLTATVKAEYALTRTVSIKASYSFERLKTTLPGADYTANVFLLGLRLQR